jgi:streptogramin lyase
MIHSSRLPVAEGNPDRRCIASRGLDAWFSRGFMTLRSLALGILVMALSALPAAATTSPSPSITEFDVGTGVIPYKITQGPGPNAALWFSNFSPTAGGVGRITTTGGITEFTSGLTAHVQPYGIILGPDGNIWFAGGVSETIPPPALGVVTPTGAITTILLSDPASELGDLTTGPDGNIWFTDSGLHKIGRITPVAHVVTEFDGLPPNSAPESITTGSDGNLWFVDPTLPGLGRITTAGSIVEFALPPGTVPQSVVTGPDGNLWFTNAGNLGCTDCAPVTPPAIGRFNPTTAAISQFQISDSYSPNQITVGPDGNLWASLLGNGNRATGAIARITPLGGITVFSTGLASGSTPWGISPGPDGNIWFVDTGCDFCNPVAPRAIGRLTLPTDQLGVIVVGTGSVTSLPAGINCGSNMTCVNSFDDDSIVTLTAHPGSGQLFSGWAATGAAVAGCSSAPVCKVPLSNGQSLAISALFSPVQTPPPPPADSLLTVDITGSGIVTGPAVGLSCEVSCATNLPTGTVVTLTAAPATGFSFTGWSGGSCLGTDSCTVVLNTDTVITATFVFGPPPPPANSVLTVDITGSGIVTAPVADLSCAVSCQADVATGTVVTLTAAPATGFAFTGWSGGGCSGIEGCTVTVNAATTVTATFTFGPRTLTALTVTTTGTATGTVTSAPAGINCGTTCSASYVTGTSVTLAATPATGYSFTGWSGGGCSGTGTCGVTMNTATSVSASFAPIGPTTASLTVTTTGPTTGTVASAPAGINCGANCSANYAKGTIVTLTATPATGFAFSGWSGGGCSGLGTCSVTLDSATTVIAAFLASAAPTEKLSVAITGSGTVTSAPVGIACTASCSANFPTGSMVTLTAAPAAGLSFAGWSGDSCSGMGPCVVTMNQATSVGAGFTSVSHSDITLVSAVLPSSRSVRVGGTATVFGTVINASPDTAATLCSVQLATSIPAGFSFQTTDAATNQVTGTPNTPVTIPPGAAQSFVLALTPNAVIAPTVVAFNFACANSPPAESTAGLNTLLFSASANQPPDIVALSVTPTSDGIIDIPGTNGTGAFAVATFNIGAASPIIASANTGATNLPVALSICQTVPATGQCMAPPAPSATTSMPTNDAATFAVFVEGSGSVPFQPATNRVFVQFQDASNTIWGSTSVAVRTK